MKKPLPAKSGQSGDFSDVRRAWLFPKTLQSAVQYPTRETLRKRGFGERNILRDWASIVGPELAKHSSPLKLMSTGPQGPMVLYIKASGAFALLIQHSEPRILEKLSLYYGYTVAQRISISQ